MTEPIKCACVHSDAYECAKIRDRRSEGYDWDGEDVAVPRRACECCCHDDDSDDEEWL